MWLRIPTSHFSLATEDSTWPSDALCQRLAVSATWRGKLLRPQSWRLAWRTEGWRMRLSGLTLPPSQANSFVAAWLDSLAGSPAKTSALLADKQESRENGAGCFSRSSDSFASWDRSSGCFSKTSRQFSIFQQEQPFLENLPRSGSMRNGELYERPMLVDRTGESGRLCWPTAVATDSNGARNETSGRSMASQHHSGTTLNDAIIKWPTPCSADSESCGNYSKTTANQLNASSADMTLMQIAVDTDAQIAKDSVWPTPKARDSKSAEGQAGMMRNDPDLNVIASRFSLPDQPTSTHGGKSPSGSTRRLNPDFVDWLMGLIPGWTNGKKIERRIYETWAAKIGNQLAAIRSTDYQQDGGEKTGAAHHTANAVCSMRGDQEPPQASSKHFERSARCGNCVPALPQEDGPPRRNQTRSDSAEEMRCLPPKFSSEEIKSDAVRDGVHPRNGAHDGAEEVEMNRVDRLRAAGNGVVPLQGTVALAILLGRSR